MKYPSFSTFRHSLSLVARKEDKGDDIEAKAIRFAGLNFVLVFIFCAVLFYGRLVPLFGFSSIGVAAGWCLVIASLVGYVIATALEKQSLLWGGKRKVKIWLQDVYTNLSIAFVFAFLSFMGSAVFFFIMQDAFKGLSFDSWSASLFAATVVAAGSYIIYLTARNMTTQTVSTLLALMLVVGALTSMMTAQDPQWWQYHFSSLGGGEASFSSKVFNVTLVVGGGVIVALADYIARDFAALERKRKKAKNVEVRVNLIRTVLVLIGIFLACVGLFAYDTNAWVHNTSAGLMAILFIGLIVGLPWVAPIFSKSFYTLSYTLMATIVVSYILFDRVGYLNLTAFELICAATIFSWLAIFIRQVGALSSQK